MKNKREKYYLILLANLQKIVDRQAKEIRRLSADPPLKIPGPLGDLDSFTDYAEYRERRIAALSDDCPATGVDK
jgi:hypothetical protein|tara:strand:+ start:403 stop:624 length:222 start_codon:yes stop_codon:yes gene_type:complete